MPQERTQASQLQQEVGAGGVSVPGALPHNDAGSVGLLPGQVQPHHQQGGGSGHKVTAALQF